MKRIETGCTVGPGLKPKGKNLTFSIPGFGGVTYTKAKKNGLTLFTL